MRSSIVVLMWVHCLFFVGSGLFGQDTRVSKAMEDPWKTLNPGHPRLYLTEQGEVLLRKQIRSSPVRKRIVSSFLENAEKILSEDFVEDPRIKRPEARKVLKISRLFLRRIQVLGMVYRLTGREEFAVRATQELRSVCRWKDWNPRHFLDVAEMAHAVALGYDWFYDRLTPEERKKICQALVEKAMVPFLSPQSHWVDFRHKEGNWNLVCNSGLVIAAVAIADQEPEKARSVLRMALASMPRALKSYAPDGGWPEGAYYWHYATRYTVYALEALKTGLGHDFQISSVPGFDRTGDYFLQMCGPSGQIANFGDGHSPVRPAEQLFWLSRRYGRLDWAVFQRDLLEQRGRYTIFDLLWFEERGDRSLLSRSSGGEYFRSTGTVVMRSDGRDPSGLFLALRGGSSGLSHNHLDLGSFVFDAHGKRWAIDLGPDRYDLPGYFQFKPGGGRWGYLRTRTQSHNTLLIGDRDQKVGASAPVMRYFTGPDRTHAVCDLSEAYQHAGVRVRRGVAMLNRSHVLIQDEVSRVGTSSSQEVVWQMATPAKVEIDGARATLHLGSQSMTLQIISPNASHWECVVWDPKPREARNVGVTWLRFRAKLGPKVTGLAVVFSPGGSAFEGGTCPLRPLDTWGGLP